MEYTTTRGRNSTRHVPVEEKQLVFFLPASGGVIHKQGSRVCTCASAVSRECLIACARYKRYMGTGFIEESRNRAVQCSSRKYVILCCGNPS